MEELLKQKCVACDRKGTKYFFLENGLHIIDVCPIGFLARREKFAGNQQNKVYFDKIKFILWRITLISDKLFTTSKKPRSIKRRSATNCGGSL